MASEKTFVEHLLDFPKADVGPPVAQVWGRLAVARPPLVDGLLAATAVHHGLTVATRNVADFDRCGVPTSNPFTTQA